MFNWKTPFSNSSNRYFHIHRSNDQQDHRFFQKDGSVRIKRKGVAVFNRISWYSSLIQMSRLKLWANLLAAYILINVFFAILYYIIGIENIEGTRKSTALLNFLQAFFFSAQTFTTVGYGHIRPTGLLANAIATFEAFVGLSTFAMVSGIFYARFAKPKPFLLFSDVALLSPHNNSQALVFRVVPYKDHYLMEAEIKVSLNIKNEQGLNQFYSLHTEREKLDALVLNWTIIHPITTNSPLYGKTLEDLKKEHAEIFVFLKAHDEVYANPVVARTSYTPEDMVENARFRRMYHLSDAGDTTILHVDMLNDYEMVQEQG